MKIGLRFFIGIFLLWVNFVSAEVRIVITDGMNVARPIAVAPFKWVGHGRISQDVSQIISSDLRNSGQFSPIAVSAMPQQPSTASEVNSKLWAEQGIDSVVLGSVQPASDGRYTVRFQLVDTLNNPGSILAEDQFLVSEQWLRYAAHAVSDAVFEKLTGIKGAFRTRIAYVMSNHNMQTPRYELSVSDYDGWNQVVLHRSSEPIMSPAWSIDGDKIAFVSFENRRSALMMKTLSTGKVEKLVSYSGHNGAPAFSPDGRKLAFSSSKSGSLKIYVMDLSTRDVRQVTTGRSNDTEPTWLPTSETLVYTSDQAGRPQLYAININGGSPVRLTWDGRQNQNASVASDGSFLVMITTNDSREQNVTRLDLNSGAASRLTSTFLDETPSISPNGMMVIYSSTENVKNVLNLVSSDGRFKARLPASEGDVRFPTWSPYL